MADEIACGAEVAAYFRASTAGQVNSVADQNADVTRVVERFGLKLVKTNADDGVSGSTIEERDAILRMISEVKALGILFILIYDISRLARGGHTDFWTIIGQLKRLGVLVYCCTNKLFITEKNAHQILHQISQARDYSVQLSRTIGRTMVANVRDRKNAPGAKPPYGYDRLYVTPEGTLFQQLRLNADGGKTILHPVTLETVTELPSNTSYAKIKTHSVRLVPGAPDRVATVRRIFKLAESSGYAQIADTLNNEGISGPSGGLWCSTTLRDILFNPAYKGDLVFNRTSKARFHVIRDGELTPLDELVAGKLNFADNPKDQWIVIPNAHEALIPPARWDAVQKAIAARQHGPLRSPRCKIRVYPLSGIAVCGRCGAPMQGNTQRGKNGEVYLRYICSTAQKYGKTRCPRASVNAGDFESFVMDKVLEYLTMDCVKASLREGLENWFDEQQTFRDNLEDIRAQLAALGKEKDELFRKLSAADLDFFKGQIDALRAKEERLVAMETAAKEKAAAGTNKAALVAKCLDHYERHVLQLKGGCENAIRESLRALGTKVVYHPDRKDGTIEVHPFGHSATN